MSTFTGTAAAESIQPGLVSPTVATNNAPAPDASDDFLFGNGGDDFLDGGGGSDQLFGGLNNDFLIWNVGGGTDLFEGGDGADTAQVNGGSAAEIFTITANGTRVRFDGISPAAFSLDIGTTESLQVNMGGGNDSISATGNLAALISIVVHGQAGNDSILGSNGIDVLFGEDDDDFIDGNQGADTAFLGNGNDVFQWDPGDGSDIVEGQAGFDTLAFNGANIGEHIDIAANGGRLRFTRDIGTVTMDLDDVEQITFKALAGADTITVNDVTGTDLARVNIDLAASGTSAPDGVLDTVTINAGTGSNTVSISNGSLAAQVMVSGADVGDSFQINGMSGEDTIGVGGFEHTLFIDGGTENDTVSYAGASASVTVNLSSPASNEGAATGHSYTSVESIIGSSFDDLLVGTSQSNTLDGGGGTDYLQGLAGDDTYRVDDAGDVVIETASGGASDQVLASVSYVLSGPARVEVLATANANAKAAINLTGNNFAQSLVGNKGDNVLKGRGGDDFLFGGRGNDVLDGGDGKDSFVFDSRLGPANIDTIKGYVKADDTMLLDHTVFAELTTLGKLSKSAFHASTSGVAHDFDDRILYETDTGKVFYDRDGIGNAAAIQFAVLNGHPPANAADFVIV